MILGCVHMGGGGWVSGVGGSVAGGSDRPGMAGEAAPACPFGRAEASCGRRGPGRCAFGRSAWYVGCTCGGDSGWHLADGPSGHGSAVAGALGDGARQDAPHAARTTFRRAKGPANKD